MGLVVDDTSVVGTKADFTTVGINVRGWGQSGRRNSITTDGQTPEVKLEHLDLVGIGDLHN